MLNYSFIDVIKTLSKIEFKELVDFANSPFHNSNKSLIRLVELLKKYHPGFDNRNLTKENVYEKIFSSGYNDQVMRNLMSDALNLVYRYFENISKGSKMSRFIKLADRLDNARFLKNDRKKEKALRYKEETPKYILPLAEKTDDTMALKLSIALYEIK